MRWERARRARPGPKALGPCVPLPTVGSRVLGSPVKHLARWAAKGPLERAGLARVAVAAIALHRLAPLLGRCIGGRALEALGRRGLHRGRGGSNEKEGSGGGQ